MLPGNLPNAPGLKVFIGLGAGILALLSLLLCVLVVPPIITPPQGITIEAPPTATPTLTATATQEPTETPTPTPTTPAPDIPDMQMEFWPDQGILKAGDCTVLHWRVVGGNNVRLNNNPVASQGQTGICPPKSTDYILSAVAGGETRKSQVGIIVQASGELPTNTPTPTRTRIPTRTPTPTPTSTPVNYITLDVHPNGIALDPVRGHLFVAGRDTNSVRVLEEMNLQQIQIIDVGSQPFGVTYYDDRVYVANFGSASVSVIDAASLSSLGTVSLAEYGGEPTHLAVDPEAKIPRLFVPMHQNGHVASLDPSSAVLPYTERWGDLTQLPSSAPGGGAYGIAALPDLRAIFVSRRDRFDLVAMGTEYWTYQGSFQFDSTFSEGSPYFVAANPELDRIYVTWAPLSSVEKPDRLTGFSVTEKQYPDYGLSIKPMRTLKVGPLGGAGGFVAVYPHDGSRWEDSVWVSVNKTVTVYNADLTKRLAVFGDKDGIDGDPYAIAINPKQSRVYVTDGEGNRVTALTIGQ